MKDKLIQIRADAELLHKVEYLRTINKYRSISETIRNIVEKEYIKEISTCNRCKHYNGVHNVLGHALCSKWDKDVLWSDYCSKYSANA